MKKLISIVTPCYNEEENIKECYEVVKNIFQETLTQYDYEHIFCDNASTDNTVKILKNIAQDDKHAKIIVNSRNFGAFCSNFNGIMSAQGDAVVVFLPADLQDPPELIINFVRKWEEGYKVVYGIKKKREESILSTLMRKIYYRIVNRFSNIPIPPDVADFQLVDKVVINALKKYDDYYPYTRGLIASCGFESIGIEYTWRKRKRGKSKSRLFSLIDQGLNGIISFSNVPLRICMLLGFLLSGLSLLFAFILLFISVIYYRKFAPPGIPTLIVSLFFFSGVQLFFIGILGEYIGAIHFQVRKRPIVIEKERINF